MNSFWAFLVFLNILILRSVIPHLDITKCQTTTARSASFVMTDELLWAVPG